MSQERDMDEITVSQAAQEYRINRGTLNNWIYHKRLAARKAFGELGVEYYLVKRGDLETFLANRSTFGRPLKRTK